MASDIITLQISGSTATVKSLQGDSTSPSIIAIFLDANGFPINIGGTSPIFYAGSLSTPGTIVNATSGTAAFTITREMTPENGEHSCAFSITGTQITVPSLTFQVYDFAFGKFTIINKGLTASINADTLQGHPASDFATATQGQKADNAVPNTRKIAGLAMGADITLSQLISAGLCPAPESGTWTPTALGVTVTGSPTYVSHSGVFYKIGKLCHIDGALCLSALGGMTGQVHLGGLPFVPASVSAVSFGFHFGINIPDPYYVLGGYTLPNSADLTITYKGKTASNNVDASALTDSFQLGVFSCDYITA